MKQAKKKILFHLSVPINTLNYDGTQGRILGVLKYFRDRKNFFAVDAVGGNKFGISEWSLKQKQEVLKFVDNVFVYEGEKNIFDFFYSRSQSFYHQKLLRQQLPVDSDYFSPPGYVKFVQTLSQQAYDFIWINNLDYAHLAKNLKSAHTLIDMHDIQARFRLVRKNIDYSRNLKFDYEANFIREMKLINKFNTVIIDSQEEKVAISPHLLPHKIHFIPTLVENSNSASNLVPYSARDFKYDLLFVGSQNQPNKDGINFFLNSVFPDIVRYKPDVRFVIAGKIAYLVEIDASLKENVDCLGYVADLSDIYLKSRLVICPLLSGAGTKFKLVEAMAYAMPIVTTKICASALSLVDGVNASITDDPYLYAHHTIRLLKEPDLAQKFSQEIAMTFDREHSSSAIYSKLDGVFSISPDPT